MIGEHKNIICQQHKAQRTIFCFSKLLNVGAFCQICKAYKQLYMSTPEAQKQQLFAFLNLIK